MVSYYIDNDDRSDAAAAGPPGQHGPAARDCARRRESAAVSYDLVDGVDESGERGRTCRPANSAESDSQGQPLPGGALARHEHPAEQTTSAIRWRPRSACAACRSSIAINSRQPWRSRPMTARITTWVGRDRRGADERDAGDRCLMAGDHRGLHGARHHGHARPVARQHAHAVVLRRARGPREADGRSRRPVRERTSRRPARRSTRSRPTPPTLSASRGCSRTAPTATRSPSRPTPHGNPTATVTTVTVGPVPGAGRPGDAVHDDRRRRGCADGSEASLTRTLQTVAIPVFQFGIFSENDLSFFAGPNFNFGGRVHTNSNLYLARGDGNTLTLADRVTTRRRDRPHEPLERLGPDRRPTTAARCSVDHGARTRSALWRERGQPRRHARLARRTSRRGRTSRRAPTTTTS